VSRVFPDTFSRIGHAARDVIRRANGLAVSAAAAAAAAADPNAKVAA